MYVSSLTTETPKGKTRREKSKQINWNEGDFLFFCCLAHPLLPLSKAYILNRDTNTKICLTRHLWYHELQRIQTKRGRLDFLFFPRFLSAYNLFPTFFVSSGAERKNRPSSRSSSIISTIANNLTMERSGVPTPQVLIFLSVTTEVSDHNCHLSSFFPFFLFYSPSYSSLLAYTSTIRNPYHAHFRMGTLWTYPIVCDL